MKVRVLLLPLLIGTLAACSLLRPEAEETPPPPATDTPEPAATEEEPTTTVAEAPIDDIQILTMESFPVQINVIASGSLPDGCTTLNEPTPRREGNTFVVNLTTTRLDEEVCTQATVPYDKVIPLDVEGLPAGTYMVAVNGLTETFTLDVDNVAQDEPEPTPTEPAADEPTPTAVADSGIIGGITGRVWHDLCAIAGGEGGEAAVPSDGCVADADGAYQANGILEAEEPGLEGIAVDLGEGECPASGLESATTDDTGAYTFADLEAGTYCVSVDALADPNSSILIPGDWTAPATETAVAATTVVVAEDEATAGINFGWDYQFLPDPEAEGVSEGTGCVDRAEFVADVTVQDNEILPPGYVFTKTWRLQNAGTCTWTTEYELIFAAGDRMGGPTSQPLPREVPPNGIIDLSVQLVTLEQNGTFRGDWLLRNAQGQRFGIPGGDGTFWLQIVVEAAVPVGGSLISGLVWSDLCRLANNTPSIGCEEIEDGVFAGNTVFDGGEPRIRGVTVALAGGACPATTALATATTGADGRYTFDELDAGTYCVFVNAQSGGNQAVLQPGQWTFPSRSEDIANTTVTVDINDSVTDVYFGWDYEAD